MKSEANTVLEARDIERTFPSPQGDIRVLRGVNLAVHANESVSIRGESGAGKTTMLSILAGMERADRGEILWDGTQINNCSRNWQARRRARFFGLIFQSYYLIPEIDALQNVLFASRLVGNTGKAALDRARFLLDRVGLDGRRHHMSGQLSGGERQRVGIARALMNNPRLILADEPTGNLDERTARDVMLMLLDLCKEEDTALILVTHNPEFAKATQRQLLLQHGVIEG